eukprot:RCo028250
MAFSTHSSTVHPEERCAGYESPQVSRHVEYMHSPHGGAGRSDRRSLSTAGGGPEENRVRPSVPSLVVAGATRARPLRLRLSLGVVVVAAMCVFTVGPAIALWMVSWQAGNDGINSIHSQGQSSVEMVAVALRSSLMRSTRSAFMDLVEPAETIVYTEAARFRSYGLLDLPGDTILADFGRITEALALQYDVWGSRSVSMVDYTLLLPTENPTIAWGPYLTYTWFNMDVVANTPKLTMYMVLGTRDLALGNATVAAFSFVNLTTLRALPPFLNLTTSLYTFPTKVSRP